MWTTLGEISNYGECNNVSVDSITDDDWVLELEDLEKDTAKIIQTLSRSKRSIKGVRHRFNKGDILYSKLRTYLNKVLVAPQSGYCTTEIMPFNSYCNVSSYYLNHVLRSAYFLDYTQQCGYGVKMPRLSTTDACNGMIPLPPLAEQKRIVKEIEHWFSLIDVIESGKEDLQATIKQAKSKILDLAIHGKLVPQDPNDEPASELLKRINSKAEITCDNGHYTQLPNGWCECQLENIVKYEQPQAYIVKSTDYDDKYLIPVLTAGKSFIIGYTNETEGIYQNTPCIIFDDFTTDSKLVDFPFKVKSSAMKILRVADSIEIEYVAMFMNITRLIGDTHKRYWISEYSKLCIPIPPKEEQKRIANAVNVMFKKLNTIMENL
ncbi:restriction endonuclease subunit S [Bacteroides thetaiotaomicron]|uniref:restriction endonuclease subunit S n=1 Tax=Bacteroides sp. TaxID=29523 RepID=UPI00130D1CE3|nr:restriction endonuclease subunit S [Bacteroides sp.]KAB4490372.1 restriction endonuclease subunit S [Bacteroides thetaiotaomicron]KAB4496768.1 restriction endonuclease subunit S [Bacteroides thetaiotaomicron]KAB4501095.1 restriction endonuclease subunit S [Bacteroides thetaiotaomicron]KAB4507837.1 restriction endonuclease subunit S [Bacteroides thetaiotaomicron]KAB4511030.1 restriction endonuclease subunit S [Bacteroides thetaiotaomicron]